jgi:hypothetical protein
VTCRRLPHRVAAAWLIAAWACGGPQRTADPDPTPALAPAPAARDSRTSIERRRDAACEVLGPRITACAVEDARANLAAGKIGRTQFDADTAPGIQRKHTDEFEKACKAGAYSSRQVRVLELCPQQETRCAPLLDCLDHLHDQPAR